MSTLPERSPDFFFVFDVESIGLHGEGFAVGFVVIDAEGNQHDCALYSCPPEAARGSAGGHAWVKENCPALPITHRCPWQVRAAFWRNWLDWRARAGSQKAYMVADCGWPVEARFLAACVEDDPMAREWEGPYPLHDLATLLLARNLDPLLNRVRKETELPEHHPLMDAKQSARILIECLEKSPT